MSTSEMVGMGVFLSLAALASLINGTFLIVICKSWTLVKRRRITYHVTNLAISDCMVGTSVFCEYITIVVAGKKTPLSNTFSKIAYMATLTSLLAVCLMAIERALCIKKPHTWDQILTLKRIFIIMAMNWVVALSLMLLFIFYTLPMMFVFLVLFYVPIAVTSVMYVNMYRKISKLNEVHESDETQQCSSVAIEERRNKLMQRKVGTVVLILTLILLITMSPTFLALLVQVSCELFQLNCKFIKTLNRLMLYLYVLAITNYIVNPIVYAFRMSLYRNAFWQLFGRTGSDNS